MSEAEKFLATLAGEEPVTFQTFSDRDELKLGGKDPNARILHGTLKQHRATLEKLIFVSGQIFVNRQKNQASVWATLRRPMDRASGNHPYTENEGIGSLKQAWEEAPREPWAFVAVEAFVATGTATNDLREGRAKPHLWQCGSHFRGGPRLGRKSCL